MRTLLLLLSLIFLISCGANTSENGSSSSTTTGESPKIEITVSGMPAGSAQLIGLYAGNQYLADTARVDANGRVVFQRENPYESGLYFVVFPDKDNMRLLIDKDQKFTVTATKRAINSTMKVEGSRDNELMLEVSDKESDINNRLSSVDSKLSRINNSDPSYTDLKAQKDALLKERKDMLNQVFADNPDAFYTAFKRAGQNPEVKTFYLADGVTEDPARKIYTYRNEFWDNVDFSDPRLMRTPVISNKLKKYIDELTVQHPDSINASAKALIDKTLNHPDYFKYFTNDIAVKYDPKKSTLMDAQAVFVFLVENYFTYDKAFWADSTEVFALQQKAYEMSASLVGKQAPDVISTDPSGNTKSIYEMKAPYIIVYMYNPDCEHCAKETPLLVDYYNKNKSNGVDVFAIAVDTDNVKWTDYIRKNQMSFTNVFDPTNKSIYAKYFVDITPEIYVLNPQRKIIAKNLKTNQIQTVIDRDKENN